MNSRSKTNNFIAILIAVILFAIGFALYFAHQQKKSDQQLGQIQSPVTTIALGISAGEKAFCCCRLTRSA
jgi:cell division protein FtsN